jgi:nucleoside-diphosphate-sugar epimerase
MTKHTLAGADVVFHLAAAVSAECEADFDLGMRANLRATESLLASCRALGTNPVVVFASSLAVFGDSGDHPLPAVVDDHTLPNPQSSYGMQKVIGEQLLADFTRKGFLRGRAVRLATVCVRPGRAQRGRVWLPFGHHPRAAGWPARRMPGRCGDRGGAHLASRVPAPYVHGSGSSAPPK